MKKPDWGKIESPVDFEILCSTLLQYEDGTVKTFLRPGSDYAIDAISGNGQTVYQFKFHKNGRRSDIVKDSRRELSKIQEYRNDGGKGAEIWKSVRRWILVTNVDSNPQTDQRQWDEIVNSFRSVGIEAEVWAEEKLVSLFVKHPDVFKSFFADAPRTLLTLEDAIEIRQRNDGIKLADFTGRIDELRVASEFLKNPNQRVLTIVGAGGVGKSRLLHQIGTDYRKPGLAEVFWVNTATIESQPNWLAGIPSRPVLLLIDEPTNLTFVRSVLEQLDNAEFQSWKVIFAVRAQNHLIASLLQSGSQAIVAKPLRLNPMHLEAGVLATELLKANCPTLPPKALEFLSNQIENLSEGFPAWITIAVRVVATQGDLTQFPKDRKSLAEKYISQLIDHSPEELGTARAKRAAIIWIAIYKELWSSDDELHEFVANKCGFESPGNFRKFVDYLAEKNFLAVFGRRARIYPDVIREHILVSELTTPDSDASLLAKEVGQLILTVEGVPQVKRLIQTMAYIELLERAAGGGVPLLDPLVEEVRKYAESKEAKDQAVAVELVKLFAVSRPKDVAAIVSIIRNEKSESSQLEVRYWGAREIDHASVMESLPSLLLDAGRYAFAPSDREAIVKELYYLSVYEASIELSDRRLANDGRRSSHAIDKLVYSGPGVAESFEKEFSDFSSRKLQEFVIKRTLNPAELGALKKFLKPLLTAQREHSFYDRKTRQFTISWRAVSKGDSGYGIRAKIKESLWEILFNSTETELLKFSLEVLATANQDLRSTVHSLKGAVEYVDNEVLEDLKAIGKFLERKDLEFSVLRVTQPFWEWHLNYDKRTKFRDLALKAKQKFDDRPNAKTISAVFVWPGDMKGDPSSSNALADELLASPTSESLFAFADDAMNLSKDLSLFHYGTQKITDRFVERYADPNVVRYLFLAVFSDQPHQRTFSAGIIRSVLAKLRNSKDARGQKNLLDRLLTECPVSNLKLSDLLYDIFGRSHPLDFGELNQIDADFIQEILRRTTVESENFYKLASSFYPLFCIDRDAAKRTFAAIFSKCSDETMEARTFNMAVDALNTVRNLDGKIAVKIQIEDAIWIFGRMKEVRDLNEVSSHAQWELAELFKHVGFSPGPKEFAELVSFRASQADRFSSAFPNTGELLSTFSSFKTGDEEQLNDLTKSVELLVELRNAPLAYSYHLNEWLFRLDPSGVVVPQVLCSLIEQSGIDAEGIYDITRLISAYPEGSEAWRTVAICSGEKTQCMREDDRARILWSLRFTGIQTWWGSLDQVHPRWQQAVDEAKQKLDSESNPYLKEYFRLRLSAAERDLASETLRKEEERADE